MTSLFRVGLTRFLSPNGHKLTILSKNGNVVRTITSKTLQGDVPAKDKPAPYNYKEKSYNLFHSLFDKTSSRFDDNSKIIVVEGPVAAGKSDLAKELAKDLGMLYLPEANLDMYYINDYGYDLRKLDDQMPDDCKSWDVKDFLMNPKHKLNLAFQIKQYYVKYSQYVDALAHLLSTGQGVVLDRCVYSDFVFTETMFSQGYLSKLGRNGYFEVRKNSIDELLRPHLLIYLDVPVPKVQENISKRNVLCEKNSTALTPAYLAQMEKVYKQQYLKEMGKHSELLVYDWSEKGDVEVIVEDIERIDFDNYDPQESKMKDWVQELEEDWAILRNKYADKKDSLLPYMNVPLFDVPEIVLDPEDSARYYEVLNNAPGEKFLEGFNKDCGDSVWFKSSGRHRNTLPACERKFC